MTPCIRCGFDQSEEAERRQAIGLTSSSRTMLEVSSNPTPKGRSGAWIAGRFIRGGNSTERYWVCHHCHAPGEVIWTIEKGRY